jgi:DNA-binding CsgD family transcriptional regulator
MAYVLYRVGLLEFGQGDLKGASLLLGQSLSLSRDLRNKRGMAVSASALACVAGIQGRADRATRLFGVATALLDASNYRLTPTLSELHRRAEANARAVLGDRGFAASLAEGRRMTLDEGIALALAEAGISTGEPVEAAPVSADHSLSQRELEVVKLICGGLTDREVAAQLSISPRTVDGHLRRIFAKTGVHSRTALAIWAVQRHIA